MSSPLAPPTVGEHVYVIGSGFATVIDVDVDAGLVTVKRHDDAGTIDEVSQNKVIVKQRHQSQLGLIMMPTPFDDETRVGEVSSAVFNLVSTILGGGIVSLPAAMQGSGMILGGIALLLSALAAAFTIDLLVLASNRTGTDGYEAIGKKAFGSRAQLATVSLIAVLTWLVLVAYTVLLGDLLVPTVEFAGWAPGDSGRRLIIIVVVVVLAPMYLQRSLSALWFGGIVAIVAVGVAGGSIIYRAFHTLDATSHIVWTEEQSHFISHNVSHTPLKLYPDSWQDFLNVFPVFGVSFLCHFNILPINGEIRRPTQQRLRSVIARTMGLCTVVYFLVGYSGMIYAGRYTCGNILLNYSPHDELMVVARVFLAITLMCSYPMLVLPCRSSFARLILLLQEPASTLADEVAHENDLIETLSSPLHEGEGFGFGGLESPLRWEGEQQEGDQEAGGLKRDEGQGETQPLDASRGGGGRNPGEIYVYRQRIESFTGELTLSRVDSFRRSFAYETDEMSSTKFGWYTAAVVSSTMTVALFLDAVMVVWTIMGATACFLISFILPCLFFLKLSTVTPGPGTPEWINRTTGQWTSGCLRRACARVLLGVSVVASVVCTVMVVKKISGGNMSACPSFGATEREVG